MNTHNKYRIFACDGGGFRGYLSSLIMVEMERKLGSNLNQAFDLYAGTSTGALIACALAYGLSAQEILNIYASDGEHIFPNFSLSKEIYKRLTLILNAFLLGKLIEVDSRTRFLASQPIFDGTELEKSTRKVFGEETFGVFKKKNKRVIVIAYDCWNSIPVIFDSEDPIYHNLKIVDILMASSAYPGGFPSRDISEPSFLEQWIKQSDSRCSHPPNNLLPVVDGGLAANNPALIALSEYLKQDHQKSSVILASFGTGKIFLRFDSRQTNNMGLLDWTFPIGDPLLETVHGGYSRISDRIIKNLLSSEGVYFRFQPLIDDEPSENFDYRIVHITSEERKQYELATFQFSSKGILEKIASRYILSNSDRLEELAQTLRLAIP
ncbi:patatin-like phospholipase family protein [Gloeocapsa sp. PCC 73106]|uniref:patatin-like phospholipase family protein n=1 Tax=Gloeocapsa sp. PCC 73106 TaxID=102232 RepID=UPI0002AC6699|nr:patatin-like phospholipase family protein [Gloeocapsa sp. PCC 73106]ELR96421.1 patatin [Gloeocapsa sp. PCC 73106]